MVIVTFLTPVAILLLVRGRPALLLHIVLKLLHLIVSCADLRPVQQRQTLTIVRMRLFPNYNEHCRSEASAHQQSRVLALLNRPQGANEVVH
jgi:hypothetical protein